MRTTVAGLRIAHHDLDRLGRRVHTGHQGHSPTSTIGSSATVMATPRSSNGCLVAGPAMEPAAGPEVGIALSARGWVSVSHRECANAPRLADWARVWHRKCANALGGLGDESLLMAGEIDRIGRWQRIDGRSDPAQAAEPGDPIRARRAGASGPNVVAATGRAATSDRRPGGTNDHRPPRPRRRRAGTSDRRPAGINDRRPGGTSVRRENPIGRGWPARPTSRPSRGGGHPHACTGPSAPSCGACPRTWPRPSPVTW